ncbi:MAG: FliM/FliN family flagellar motor switch protein [Candidatus Sulfotelmatobacter sp.]|jgi:flagellar motor switch protein FliN
MPTITPGTPLQFFMDALRKATGDVFSQALGANWDIEIDTADAAPSVEPSALCFQLSSSGALQGNTLIQVGSADALLLAQKFLAEPLDPAAELNQDRKDALEELLRQVAGLAATTLKSLLGETKLEVRNIEPPDWQGVNLRLLASEASSAKLTLEVRISPELLASAPSTKTADTVPTPATDLEASAASVTHEPNFDLLLGVNLSLTLRFGQRVLPLREILDLASGSVIELDHEVQEPADLLLGDKVIARGHVVIVDGNYGIRITEVSDARQRIGTL